jgi:hypothetical protein
MPKILSDQHFAIFQKFFDKYFNGNPAFHEINIPALLECKSIHEMHPVYGVFCARALVHGIFAYNPAISFPEFEHEMLYRAGKANELLIKHQEKLGKIVAEHPDQYWANRWTLPDDLVGRASQSGANLLFSYFSAMGDAEIPFNEQLRSFRLFCSFAPKWAGAKPVVKGDFVITKTFLLHNEAPLCLAVRTKDGLPVASVGGFIAFRSGRPEIHITNIQGAGIPAYNREKSEIHRKLNEALGENWRVFFARQVAEYAGRKEKGVVGSLPPRFYIGPAGKPAASDNEFLRQVKQYQQTYRKAGLQEQPDGKWLIRLQPRRRPK